MNISQYEALLLVLNVKIHGIRLMSLQKPEQMAQKLHDLKEEVEDLISKAREDSGITTKEIERLEALASSEKLQSDPVVVGSS